MLTEYALLKLQAINGEEQFVHALPALAAPVDVDTWCPVGPGARRGLNRLAGRRVEARVPFRRLLGEMRETLRDARGRVPFLRLHDVQFALCELDKYERARTGGGRMKRKYNAAQ